MRFRSLEDGQDRQPTWAEREHLDRLRSQGVDDVYIDVAEAPPEFWRSVTRGTSWHLAPLDVQSHPTLVVWAREFFFATGLPDSRWSPAKTYRLIVEEGRIATGPSYEESVEVGVRIAAVEHMMDAASGSEDFALAISDKARELRIGVAVESARFVPVASQHMHKEVVRPTLLLLTDRNLEPVDDLYRKSFDRYFAHDHAGAITAATSAVEEYLRYLLDTKGGQLGSLLQSARSAGVILPAVEQVAKKLAALRDESDAHTAGTDDPDVAMFGIHTAGAVLLHLASRGSRT